MLRDHLVGLGLVVGIERKWILTEIWCENVDWIRLTQDRDTSDCIKAEEFITKIAAIIFLRMVSTLWS